MPPRSDRRSVRASEEVPARTSGGGPAGKLTRTQQAAPAQAERGEGADHQAAVRATTQKLAPWVMDDDSMTALGLAPTAGEGAAEEARDHGPEAMWRQVIGERSTAVGQLARVRAPRGVRLRQAPSAAAPELGILPFDELVSVERRTDHGWCWVVSASARSGSAGCCEEQFLAMNPPEPTAHLYRVAPGDSLREIAEGAYGKSFREGRDARLYVQALYEANKHHRGIYLSEVELSAKESLARGDDEERTIEIYKGAKVREGHALWIPSEAFIEQLRVAGAITGGTSTPKQLWRSAEAGVGHALEGAAYGAAFTVGILEGSWSALVDLFKGAAEMIQLVGKTMYELISGDLGALKDMLMGWVEKLKLAWAQRGDIAADFMAKWESDDAWTRGNFQGEVLGWVMMTALLILATAGEAAVAMATGRWATVLRVLRTADALGDVTAYVAKATHLPREAVAVLRTRFGKGAENVAEGVEDAGARTAKERGLVEEAARGGEQDRARAIPSSERTTSPQGGFRGSEHPVNPGGGRFGIEQDSSLDLLTDPNPPTEVFELRRRLSAPGEGSLRHDAMQAFRRLVRELLTRRNQEIDSVLHQLSRTTGNGLETLERRRLEEVFDYLFQSHGIQLDYSNYAAWRRLSQGSGTVDDLRFLSHELEELEVLREGGLEDPVGKLVAAGDVDDWRKKFVEELYLPAHRKALEKELDFLCGEIRRFTKGEINLSREELAMSDPLRDEARVVALRGGKPMLAHARAKNWNRSAEHVELSEETASSLALPRSTKIADVIQAVKQHAIGSSR